MINPDVPAPLPPNIVPETVYLGDGTPEAVVTIRDAARLTGKKVISIERWIAEGKVAICETPDHQRRVLVSSLWLALPIELRR